MPLYLLALFCLVPVTYNAKISPDLHANNNISSNSLRLLQRRVDHSQWRQEFDEKTPPLPVQ